MTNAEHPWVPRIRLDSQTWSRLVWLLAGRPDLSEWDVTPEEVPLYTDAQLLALPFAEVAVSNGLPLLHAVVSESASIEAYGMDAILIVQNLVAAGAPLERSASMISEYAMAPMEAPVLIHASISTVHLAEALLALGANAQATDAQGKNALEYLVSLWPTEPLVAQLLERGAQWAPTLEEGSDRLVRALERGLSCENLNCLLTLQGERVVQLDALDRYLEAAASSFEGLGIEGPSRQQALLRAYVDQRQLAMDLPDPATRTHRSRM